MRKLQTSDVFEALRLIRQADLKEQLRPIIKLAGEGNLALEELGIEGALTIVEAFAEPKAEMAFYTLLSGPFEMEPADIQALDIVDFAKLLKQLSEENDLKAFFGYLSGILGKK